MAFHSSRCAGTKRPAFTRAHPICGRASAPSTGRSAIQPMSDLRFDGGRFVALLETLQSMASGQVNARLPSSPHQDALDKLAHGINALVGELASAEARTGAVLKAVPDLMFVLLPDGTFVDYHARDPKLLFVPPSAYIGRKIGEVLPPA